MRIFKCTLLVAELDISTTATAQIDRCEYASGKQPSAITKLFIDFFVKPIDSWAIERRRVIMEMTSKRIRFFMFVRVLTPLQNYDFCETDRQ